ncbi:MAG TPA: fumarylacetoacetate hydrolase family protein [Candidatus Binatia bacterium]|nr:fumarylacetoacetate hydrolase family protein [Candidatus Binatia bacterium]
MAQKGLLSQRSSMIDFIARYDSVKNILESAISTAKRVRLDSALLKPPVRPSKIWAAAFNYKRGTSDIKDAAGRGETLKFTLEQALEMTFLKPPSAVIGPEQTILIPKGERVVYPELELCVVIGKEARNVAKDNALDHVFGYTVMLDMTARGPNPPGTGVGSCRSVRKGFETFAPIGPWITTRDEIPNPHHLTMNLWIDGELRQSANTSGMINGVAELVSFLSEVTTLLPGDLISTGNPDSPAFQRKLVGGEKLKAEIENIGVMNLFVGNA